MKEKETAPLSIHQRILAVQDELTPVKKKGVNTFHKYTYATEADILATLNPLLVKHGLTHYVTQDSATVEPGKATVRVKLSIIDAATGDDLSANAWGYAEDKNSDKALYKAVTGATKYAYLKFFGLSTEDDPENDQLFSQHRIRKAPGEKNTPKFQEADESILIRSQLNELFSTHKWLDPVKFSDLAAFQNPMTATLEQLQEALTVVQKTVSTRKSFSSQLSGIS